VKVAGNEPGGGFHRGLPRRHLVFQALHDRGVAVRDDEDVRRDVRLAVLAGLSSRARRDGRGTAAAARRRLWDGGE
jgi:hypothetical protein